MTADRFKSIALGALRTAITAHSSAFIEKPSAENFGLLEQAMYAWQFAYKADSDELTKMLENEGVGHWEKKIYSYVINRNSARTVENLQKKGHLL